MSTTTSTTVNSPSNPMPEMPVMPAPVVVAPTVLNSTSIPLASNSLPAGMAAAVIVPLPATQMSASAPPPAQATPSPQASSMPAGPHTCNTTVQGQSYYKDPNTPENPTLYLGPTNTLAAGIFTLVTALTILCILYLNFSRGSGFANVLLFLLIIMFAVLTGFVFKFYVTDKADLTRPCIDVTGKTLN